jgi:uncharacterized protein involved in exopolysaccharide biosynthesis
MEAYFNSKDIQGVIRRRYKASLLIFSVIVLASVIVAVVLPPKYLSSAVIMIEEQQIPEDYIKSTITTYAEERLHLINRQIMKYSQMEDVIKKTDLYPELTDKGDWGGAISKLKDSIALDTISFKEGNKTSTIAFSLSFEGDDPKTVYKVTEVLSNLYLKEEAQARKKLTSVTTDFFKQELSHLKEQVRIQEERMSKFKSEHIGLLPENASYNLHNISRLEMEIERIYSRIRTLEDRKIYLKGQLANVEPLLPVKTDKGKLASNPKDRLKRLRLELIQMQARLSDKHPDIRKIKSEIAKLEDQVGQIDEAVYKVKTLSDKRAKLAELKGSLGRKHPDVIRLTKEVKILSAQVDKLLTDKSVIEISEERPDNPTYINLMTQIVSADAEIKSLRKKEKKNLESLAGFRDKVSKAPLIEQEYNEIKMELNGAKDKYKEILSDLTTAQVAQQMETQQKGEKFTILEPAYYPSAPYKPNRILITLLGVIVAFGISVSFAALQEGMDHSVKSEDELVRISDLPVLASLTMVKTNEEHSKKRKRYIFCAFCAVCAAVIILVFMIKVPVGN